MTDIIHVPEADPWLRIAAIQRDRWAPNPVSDGALKRARLAVSSAGRLRPRAVLFWGPPNAGKSALREKIVREIERNLFIPGRVQAQVVVSFEAPPEADEARFYEALLQGAHRYIPPGNNRTLLQAVTLYFEDVRPDVMILDEVGNLNAYTGARGAICLNALRRLCNVHKVALLGFGTATAMTAMQADEQLENRLEIFHLRPLTPPEFTTFVDLMTSAMPLLKPTVWSSAMLERAYEMTGGYVGRTVYLIHDTATEAVLSGIEQITLEILDSDELAESLAALRQARMRAGRRGRRSGGER
ncbi:MAG: TniB family NTP-binding protein [Brevundimonas sp.]